MTTLSPIRGGFAPGGVFAPTVDYGDRLRDDIDLQIDREREAATQRVTSPYTFAEKIKRVAWAGVEMTLFRNTFHNWYGIRNVILRLFGAKVHHTARVRRTVHVEIPWNLSLGEFAVVGDHATLYCLGPVTIGRHTTISQNVHICAGTHDYNEPQFPLKRVPVSIGDHAWIAADAFVGPNVSVGDGAVLGARGVAMRDLDAWTVYAGNPCVALKKRRRRAA